MRTWIRGGRIITPRQSIEDGVIVIESGRVTAIESRRQLASQPPDTRVIDGEGYYVLPGLIDLHTHGAAGSDTMDATPQALERMADFHIKHGVTAFLPTTLASSGEAIGRALENLSQSRAKKSSAQPLGIHLEGPYLSQLHRGAQPAEWLRDPIPDEYRPWLDTGLVRLIALAPELPGALQLIQEGVARGVHFSAGHTGASYEQIYKAADEGLSQATHTFNGMLGLHHREPGAVGAVLDDSRIFCEAIADGVHVHPAVLRLLVRAKGVERTVLVTDSIRAAGLPDGEYDLHGQKIIIRDGVSRTVTGGLAGSTLTMNRAVINMVRFCELSLNQAVAMATASPAAALGLTGKKGVIQPGADADIILVDDGLNVKAAMVGGELVYQPDLL
jgi:N-acetylglucosamine-6-phosphate deacetylase